MQILPSSDATRAKAGLETLGGYTPGSAQRQAQAFSTYFDACLNPGQDNGTDSLAGANWYSSLTDSQGSGTSASAANKAVIATSGLLSSGMGNVVSDPKTVRMSREDFAQLRSSLAKSGISEKEIANLESRIDTPQGLTWGAFMAFLQQKMLSGSANAGLTTEDKRNVQNILGKLGFTPGETSQLVSDMEQGQAGKVWGTISLKLAGLSAETASSVTSAEVQALAKGLGLSTSAQNRLSELFSQMGETDAADRDIRTALFAIAAEAKNKALSDTTALAKVTQQASQVFVSAQKREFGQTLSDAREDQVARKALLANEMESGKDKAVGEGHAVLAGDGHKAVQTDVGQGLAGVVSATKTAAATSANGRQETTTDDHGTKDRAKSNLLAMERGGATGRRDAASTDPEWSTFWKKIGRDTDGVAGTRLGESLKAALAGTTATTPTVTPTVQTTTASSSTPSYASADVLRQVESGMLKNLGQGGHRITLNLTPDELGSVSVMLTVKDKDVQAVIKAETPEAARIISENLTRVRENLEQQGLKVSKLDVQAGLTQQQDQSAWQGAGQHNEARRQQEEVSMRRTALRLMEMSAGAAASGSEMSVERHVPSYGAQGVDVFA